MAIFIASDIHGATYGERRVVEALLFFGVGVAVLDNLVVTPLLVLVSGLGA